MCEKEREGEKGRQQSAQDERAGEQRGVEGPSAEVDLAELADLGAMVGRRGS